MFKKIVTDRNMLLVIALVLGILVPNYALLLKPYITILLAIVMSLSLSGLALKMLTPIKYTLKPLVMGVFLNHILFGVFIFLGSLFFYHDKEIFYGMIVIAATPPGVAIIPFTVKLKGDILNSIIGTFGAFIASVILAPLILSFVGDTDISPISIIKLMGYLIVIPFIVSRLLRLRMVLPIVEKSRGAIIDVGFAFIIYVSVGINSHVFNSDILLLSKIAIALLFVMVIVASIYSFIFNRKKEYPQRISQKLLFGIKSSGFAVVTSLDLFGDRAAIPATVMSVLVLLYLLSLIVFYSKKNSST